MPKRETATKTRKVADTFWQDAVLEPLEDDREFSINIEELRTFSLVGLPIEAQRHLDATHLQYVEASDHRRWEPISITKTTRGYVIIDGLHRVEAAKRKKLRTIRAKSSTYASLNDIVDAAFSANLEHGLPASLGFRVDYAWWLHKTFPKMVQKEIAARAHIAQSTVSEAFQVREKRKVVSTLAKGDTKAQEEPQQEQRGKGVAGEPAAPAPSEEEPVAQKDQATMEREQAEKAREAIFRQCHTFIDQALRFVRATKDVDDSQLIYALSTAPMSSEDCEQLAHLATMLSSSIYQKQRQLAGAESQQVVGKRTR